MNMRARILGIIGIALTAIGLSGCATAEKSDYARHLAAIVEPGPVADDAVAVAFHLDDHRAQPEMIDGLASAVAGRPDE
jgi:hypothetical protein